ncbi:MGDG synthase family glycosyltransferase [Actinoallomurus bryophytorum]|uniref:MGDG synthase family glycosyltransferase n=1 Tax=Actinoallomurus bryophytorum TaxID=1490222 RepID=UPI001FE75069|nr:hypothetical protein [Actinoallomurus bryophytorum]
MSASMGAGHDRVACELTRRLAAIGIESEVIDVLDLLPLRLGPGLRRCYAWTVRHAPWVYAGIYRIFFTSSRGPAISPLTVLAASRLERAVRRREPAALLSTFHLGAQVAGYLRRRGRLPVPSLVMVTDFAVHRLWLHPGNDGYLCLTPAAVRDVRAATGRPAWCHAPVVGPEFGRRDTVPVSGPGPRPVLVAAGSWGVGRVDRTARVLAASGRYLPVVMCGSNERLRRRVGRIGACVAVGWREDPAELMTSAYALVDNASGLTCKEALAAGVPVIGHRPIPGHGADGARAMARAGLARYARDAAELLASLDGLGLASERDRQVARGRAMFDRPSAETVLSALLP